MVRGGCLGLVVGCSCSCSPHATNSVIRSSGARSFGSPVLRCPGFFKERRRQSARPRSTVRSPPVISASPRSVGSGIGIGADASSGRQRIDVGDDVRPPSASGTRTRTRRVRCIVRRNRNRSRTRRGAPRDGECRQCTEQGRQQGQWGWRGHGALAVAAAAAGRARDQAFSAAAVARVRLRHVRAEQNGGKR